MAVVLSKLLCCCWVKFRYRAALKRYLKSPARLRPQGRTTIARQFIGENKASKFTYKSRKGRLKNNDDHVINSPFSFGEV